MAGRKQGWEKKPCANNSTTTAHMHAPKPHVVLPLNTAFYLPFAFSSALLYLLSLSLSHRQQHLSTSVRAHSPCLQWWKGVLNAWVGMGCATSPPFITGMACLFNGLGGHDMTVYTGTVWLTVAWCVALWRQGQGG